MSARNSTSTTPAEGFRLWPGALDRAAQEALLAEVLAAIEAAPLYRPVTPGGKPFSVMMTSMGPLGWVSDRGGYRYQPTHPETGRPWPPVPAALLDLWDRLAGADGPPDACLVNLYRGPAKMGLHQDRDELASGDVCRLSGPDRLMRHGIDRVLEGSSGLIPGGGRINLTLRRAL